jgi:hypothetical protein
MSIFSCPIWRSDSEKDRPSIATNRTIEREYETVSLIQSSWDRFVIRNNERNEEENEKEDEKEIIFSSLRNRCRVSASFTPSMSTSVSISIR